jgi:hypothetical protein
MILTRSFSFTRSHPFPLPTALLASFLPTPFSLFCPRSLSLHLSLLTHTARSLHSIHSLSYASWGVDLLKYDNCGDQHTIGQPEARYPVMRDALNATGRQMIFAGCEWAVDFPATWAAPVMHSWRATYDIQNMWECVVPHLDWLNVYADFAGPGQLGHPLHAVT